MRNLLVLFQVGSKFLPSMFLLQNSLWPIPRPLWFVPLVIKGCPCVAPFARRRRLSCCLFWWIVSIFRLFVFGCFVSVYSVRFPVGRAEWTEWSTGPAKAGTLTESAESWDVGHQRRRDRCKSGSPESSVEENLPDEEGVRGNRAWEVFCDGAVRCCQHSKSLLLSIVPEECIRAHPWAPWTVAAFSGTSSLCSWPALASWNTWVARAGFPRKSIDRRWAGAAEGEDSEGSFCSPGSGASVCRGLDLWRSWCDRPSVASPDECVLPGGWVEDGRELRSHWETVGAVCANRWASKSGSCLDTRRSFGRFRGFPEPLRLIPDSHCCFAFSQLCLLERCLEFCRELLGGQRLIISMGLSSRSVVSHCGPSFGRGRRALSVGLLWMLSTVSQLMLHTM